MNSISSTRPVPKPKHWLLAKSCQWHKWGGLIVGLFLLVVGTSGIVLNYKKPLFTALGLEKEVPRSAGIAQQESKTPKPVFTTATGLAAMPVGLERALELARAEWGDVALERIELKNERGEMIYKLKQKGGDELWVSAVTGNHFVKGEYERVSKAGADGVAARQTDWGEVLIDLHAGKIGGEVGKTIMSLAALGLLFLTLSGIYLWAKPLLVRRQNAKAQLADIPAGRSTHIGGKPVEV